MRPLISMFTAMRTSHLIQCFIYQHFFPCASEEVTQFWCNMPCNYNIYLSFRSCDSCRRLPEPKHHSFLFNHWSASKCLVVMAARTPSIHVFLGRPLFPLSPGFHSIINFGSLSSCILLTWPYHWSLFLSMMSKMSGFSFTPIIFFICSFFILSIIDFFADLLSTSQL